MYRLIRLFIGWLLAPLGIFAYRAVKKKNCFDILICDHIGDFVYTVGYLKAFKKINKISKLRIISTKNLQCILKFYPNTVDDYKAVSKRYLQLMLLPYRYRPWRRIFCKSGSVKVIEPARDFVEQYDYVKSFPNLTLADCIKYGILRLPPDTQMNRPSPSSVESLPGDSQECIMLCPSARIIRWQECSGFFRKLDKLLSNEGYNVVVNDEKVPLDKFAETALRMDIIIGARSGLLDFAALLGCSVIAVYPRGDKMMQYFDLKKMSEDKNKVFQYELTNNLDDDIKNILKFNEHGRKTNMNINYIIVQAGGKGTRMEHLTRNKPKALVPIDNLPMIFHLFRKYPDKKYLIIGDYKYDVLEKYLNEFAEVKFEMIDARGKKGTCSGMQEALEKIPDNEAFMFIWCDLILSSEYEMPVENKNYIGISGDFKCRWKYENGRFSEEASVEHGVAGHFIFKDKSQLDGIPSEGEFVRWLRDTGKCFEPYPLHSTKEYGLLSDYVSAQKKKCRPFNRITVEGNCVIKEAIDIQGRRLAEMETAWYERLKEKKFKNLPVIYSTSPLKMELINGKNIYEYDLNFDEKSKVLSQLIECIKNIHNLDTAPADRKSCYEAYIGKTFKRLERVRNLVPFADNAVITINGQKCRNIFYHREQIENAVEKYFPEKFCLIHGDCTFSNMLMRNDTTPVMIDPRGYFGFTRLLGDAAYDWAKLYYSIVGNYDRFNLRQFELSISENEIMLKIESNGWEDMEESFFKLLEGEVTIEQIKLFHAIIWLSLTTYAWEDYDSICGAFYNGLMLLEDSGVYDG